MTLIELANVLKATGYPVAYSHFKTKQRAPFIVYKESYTSNFGADNRVHTNVKYIDIELYTTKKDLAAENRLEQKLSEHGIYWNAVETFIDTENIFQRIYEIKII